MKEEYQKACDIIIEDCMALQLIHPKKYLIKRGIKRGVAGHIVDDIPEWLQKHKRARIEE